MQYELTVAGIVDDGFTSVEIERDGMLVARVFETESGWHVQLGEPDDLCDPQLVHWILEARRQLLNYVNRTGVGRPEGLTRAGLSFWLLQKRDGA